MVKVVWTVFARETLDLLRDRRALFFLFALPLLMPLLGAIGGIFVTWQVLRQTRGGLPIHVVNREQLPELVDKLENDRNLQLVEAPPDIEEALQSGDLMATLEIPLDAVERLTAEEPITVALTSSRSGWMSDVAVGSIRGVLNEYADDVLKERLARRGLDREWTDPVRLGREVAAPTGVVAAPIVEATGAPSSLGDIFLPLVIASWAFSGGLSLVASMTVGEKERRTMESLLITPTNRIGIVLGKIALSIIVSVITVGLWALDSLAYVFLLSILSAGSAGLTTPIAAQIGNLGLAAGWLVLLMLPLMTAANGLVAAVCTFAKNYRESNLFLGVLQLLLPGLALLSTFGAGATPPLAVYVLPGIGVLVAMRDILGGGIAPAALALTWGTATVYAIGSILLAAYVFSREWALMRGV